MNSARPYLPAELVDHLNEYGKIVAPYLPIVLPPVGIYAAYKLLCYVVPGPHHQAKLNLKNRTVLITGASTGVGRALSFEFYSKGAKVILTARSIDKLQELCNELEDMGRKEGWQNPHRPVFRYLDLAELNGKSDNFQQIDDIRALAIDGKTIDVLINNAGVSNRGSCQQTSINVQRQVMEVNFFGHVAITKTLLESIPDDGAIVTVNSLQGRVALPYRSAYSASKHAQQGAKLILASRNTRKLQELCEELEAVGKESGWKNTNKPVFKQLDIEELKDKTEAEVFDQMACIRALARDGETIDVLVNNAGLMSCGSAKETQIAVIRRVMEVNFFGHIALTKAVLDFIPDDGAIVTMSSILGRGVALPYQAPYSASKHAVQAFFDAVRGEERPQLQILTVAAGYINSGFGSRALDVGGKPTGREDPDQLKGYSSEYSAQQIVQAVVDRETELLLAPFVHRLLLSLRLFTPNLLWWILSKRSKKHEK